MKTNIVLLKPKQIKEIEEQTRSIEITTNERKACPICALLSWTETPIVVKVNMGGADDESGDVNVGDVSGYRDKNKEASMKVLAAVKMTTEHILFVNEVLG